MVLSKRERVIRTLELEEPDMVPIHYLGFETTGISNQYFEKSDEYKRSGVYLGQRNLSNGSTFFDSEYGWEYTPEEHIKVALVSLSAKENPVYVPFDSIKAA